MGCFDDKVTLLRFSVGPLLLALNWLTAWVRQSAYRDARPMGRQDKLRCCEEICRLMGKGGLGGDYQ